MAAIHDLIAQISDQPLRDRLLQEWSLATKEKRFGLVFEDHLPEVLPIYSAKPRRGDRVAQKDGALSDTWLVRRVHGDEATCIRPDGKGEPETFAINEIVVVRQFGEPIFPALMAMDQVQNGQPDAPWHTLIEADNYHALQLLEYLYAGQVDCIYIDPPYNTGARDWKYNNDFVDGNDSWRHSKWLAFMERRLKIAKRLLKSESGILIVTIDKNELHHLGILLEQVIPGSTRQIVTICINPSGSSGEGLSRVEEYAIFCFMGDPNPSPVDDDGLSSGDSSEKKGASVGWESLLRRGNAWFRKSRPNLCYPVILSKNEKEIVGIGSPLPFHDDEKKDLAEEKNRPLTHKGLPLAWPVRSDGRLGIWRVEGKKLKYLKERQLAYVTKKDEKRQTWSLKYLMEGSVNDLDSGKIEIIGKGKFGENLLKRVEFKQTIAKTIWNRGRHIAGGAGGTNLLVDILGKRDLFSFPKSVYAVYDTINAAIGNRKNALIVDFFAGSGTTLNAIHLLNAGDGGQRRCILVTNNEVSAEEGETQRARGLQPGEEEWEAFGICRSVTWPRSKFAILGRRDDGTPLPGDYLTGKAIEREKGRSFTQIGFIDPTALNTVAKKRQLVALIDGLPQSLVSDACPFIVSPAHSMSVLFDVSAAEDWIAAIEEHGQITDFYIVTQARKVFDALKEQVIELLGPVLVNEEEKRPLSIGFPANLAYFKLDFLDKDRVTLKKAFKEILPLLWLKTGAIGPRPECPEGRLPHVFLPVQNTFAVLLDETRLADFVSALRPRNNLTHIFLVTDDPDAFKDMIADLSDHLSGGNPVITYVHLYRNYLENFMINRGLPGGTRA